MKILFISIIIFIGFPAFAQSSQELSPKILLLDTSVNLAPSFNAEVLKYAPGYRLLGSEKEPGQRLIYSFTDGREGSLRIEYKYESGTQKVIYQSITADLELIVPIFNALFRTNISTDIDHASTIGGPMQYHHKEYQCMMQADEYTPGYWMLSFVK